ALREIATGGVQDAFGLRRRAGRIHDVERLLGVERLRLVRRRLSLDDVVPPDVARQPDRKSTRLNSSHDQNSYAVFCLKKKTVKGHTYSYPFQRAVQAMYYRKDMFRQAGLYPDRPPRTWDEFYAACQKLTDPEKGSWGF